MDDLERVAERISREVGVLAVATPAGLLIDADFGWEDLEKLTKVLVEEIERHNEGKCRG